MTDNRAQQPASVDITAADDLEETVLSLQEQGPDDDDVQAHAVAISTPSIIVASC